MVFFLKSSPLLKWHFIKALFIVFLTMLTLTSNFCSSSSSSQIDVDVMWEFLPLSHCGINGRKFFLCFKAPNYLIPIVQKITMPLVLMCSSLNQSHWFSLGVNLLFFTFLVLFLFSLLPLFSLFHIFLSLPINDYFLCYKLIYCIGYLI